LTRYAAYGVTGFLTAAVFVAEGQHAPSLVIFIVSALSLLGLVLVFGQATESFGRNFEPRIGGLLRANLDTAAKLISPFIALTAGLTTVAKTSIIGSIVVSPLLVLGTCMLLGGLKNGTQTFSRTLAGIGSSMLGIVVVALTLPTIFYTTTYSVASPPITTLSIEVAAVMVTLYILYFIFFYRSPELLTARPWYSEVQETQLGRTASFVLLAATTLLIGFVADIFVKKAVSEVGISEAFVGIILIPVVGNIAEHIVCLRDAYRNNIGSSINDSIDSSLRVALVITPMLIFSGPLLGHPFRLVFGPLQLASLLAAVVVIALVTFDGRCHWLEGTMLCGLYTLMALAFAFVS
jgi:Ca2+:H+ antiporter